VRRRGAEPAELPAKNWHLQQHKRLMRTRSSRASTSSGAAARAVEGVYWYGSRLSIEEARRVAPHNNATSLQVTAPVLAGVIWAIEHPQRGIVEPDEIDFRRILEICQPYLARWSACTATGRHCTTASACFPEDLDRDDPWQFKNIRVV